MGVEQWSCFKTLFLKMCRVAEIIAGDRGERHSNFVFPVICYPLETQTLAITGILD